MESKNKQNQATMESKTIEIQFLFNSYDKLFDNDFNEEIVNQIIEALQKHLSTAKGTMTNPSRICRIKFQTQTSNTSTENPKLYDAFHYVSKMIFNDECKYKMKYKFINVSVCDSVEGSDPIYYFNYEMEFSKR